MILDKYLIIHVCIIKRIPLAGLEPATSQLEAERAIRLRHKGIKYSYHLNPSFDHLDT